MSDNTMTLTVGSKKLKATFAGNSSAAALRELLADGPRTVEMRDYGSMEKVGDLGATLPTNDEDITTSAGDLILFQGRALVIYYASNTWSFTRLGKIADVSARDLKKVLGPTSVDVTLSLD